MDLEGKDTNMSFTAWYGDVADEHATAVQILFDAGAVFYRKTSVPQAGMVCAPYIMTATGL